jgi:hypothetical protein
MQAKELAAVSVEIARRRDILLTQAMTLLIASFEAEARAASARGNTDWWRRVADLGFLFHLEALLPASNRGCAQMEDCFEAVAALRRVHLRVVEVPPGNGARMVRILYRRQCYCVEICFSPELGNDSFGDRDYFDFTALPQSIRDGQVIVVVPVLTAHGLGAAQSYATNFCSPGGEVMLGASRPPATGLALQQHINADAVRRFGAYLASHIEANTKHVGASEACAQVSDASNLLASLKRKEGIMATVPTVMVKSTGNVGDDVDSVQNDPRAGQDATVDAMLLAQQLTRCLGGGRVTCCKDGGDLTSMAATLEQAVILNQMHGLRPEIFHNLLATMRSQGVRRRVSVKNRGRGFYHFTPLETRYLPELFRPPEGTTPMG